MKFLTSLNSRFKIGVRIYAGFGFVLLLMLGVAAMGYTSLSSSNYTFERYSAVAHNAERMLVDDAALREARVALAAAVRQVLANGLALLGVSAPESM